jgi:hypothetical protein
MLLHKPAFWEWLLLRGRAEAFAVGGAGFFELFVVGLGPVPDAAEGGAEALAEGGEGVFDAGWDDGVDGAGDEAVGLHLAEGLGEHLLADAGDELGEAGEADCAVLGEGFEEEEGPLVGYAGDDLLDEAVDGGQGGDAGGGLEVDRGFFLRDFGCFRHF